MVKVSRVEAKGKVKGKVMGKVKDSVLGRSEDALVRQ
jgi:hypothetical protein